MSKQFNVHPLTLQQSRHLLTTLQGHPYKALFTLALATGMRSGELRGVKWQDIDLEAKRIHVRRTLLVLPSLSSDEEYPFVETKPKTSGSDRSIPIAPFALEVLTHHYREQAQIRQQADEHWHASDLVFCTAIGTPLSPRTLSQERKQMCRQASLPVLTFHDLRRTTVFLLISLGVAAAAVASIMGYALKEPMLIVPDPQRLDELKQEAMQLLHNALTLGDTSTDVSLTSQQ